MSTLVLEYENPSINTSSHIKLDTHSGCCCIDECVNILDKFLDPGKYGGPWEEARRECFWQHNADVQSCHIVTTFDRVCQGRQYASDRGAKSRSQRCGRGGRR